MSKSFNRFQTVIIILFAVFFISSYLYVIVTNNKAEKQLNNFVSNTLGAPVYFGSFDLSRISKTIKIKNIRIKNLKGFPDHDMITIEDLRATSDDFSASPLVLNSIFINGLRLYQAVDDDLGNNFSFFNHFQEARRQGGFALAGDRPVIIKALVIGNATLNPTKSTENTLTQAYPIDHIIIEDIGKAKTITASQSLSQMASYFSKVAQRNFLKARLTFSTGNLSKISKSIGTNIDKLSDNLTDDVLDIGNDIDEGLRSFGKSLGNSIFQMNKDHKETIKQKIKEREEANGTTSP